MFEGVLQGIYLIIDIIISELYRDTNFYRFSTFIVLYGYAFNMWISDMIVSPKFDSEIVTSAMYWE